VSLLDFLSSLIGKKVARPQRRPPVKAVVLEEIKLNLARKRKAVQKKKKVLPKGEVDMLKKFQEAVEILRQYAGLPPVEELLKKEESKKEEKKEEAGQEEAVQEKAEGTAEKEVKPEKEVKKEAPPASTEKVKKKPSLAEREKIIKLAKKKLERAVMDIVNQEIKELGLRSLREKARRRRVARDFLREKDKEIEKTFARLFDEGIDILRDDVVGDVARELYRHIKERIALEEKIVVEPTVEEEKAEKKEEAPTEKKSPKDELLDLLGGEKREERREEEDDLLKLLEES